MPPRSAAEIALDAQPPADATALADPLMSRLSHPVWLIALGVIALVSFWGINVIAFSSVKEQEPSTTPAIPEPIVENTATKSLRTPVQEAPQPPPPKPPTKAPSTPQPQAALLTDTARPAELPVEKPPVQPKKDPPKTTTITAVVNDARDATQSVSKPRGRQEIVHFSTVDHLRLAGTLYHGWKGKRGMTVLMLHDLGSHRNSPGWKRLAEALQADGHTVLTFDFRGHGESKTLSPQFWKYSVNKSLPSHVSILPAEKQPMRLEAGKLPFEYKPWLIEDIAAARTFLDLRHDEPSGPVNTFNLVVIGAGQASALGSLWLATEGLRYNASESGNKILVKWPEKLSVLQAVWIGMADPLKLNPFGIHSWLEAAHEKPSVPITFIYGEEDIDTSTVLSLPIRKKFGNAFVIRAARQSGQGLLETNRDAAAQIQKYVLKTLQSLPPSSSEAPVNWVPRNIKSLRSFWRMELPGRKRQARWIEAKRAGEEMLLPVPFVLLGIAIKGLEEPNFLPDEEDP